MLRTFRHIAFIGTGVMGHSMAGHLLDKGYAVTVYNRTRAKAADLADKGAVVADTVAEAVAQADLVISIVGYPADVREVWLGENGALAHMQQGACGIDMTTSDPALAREIAAEGAKRGLVIGDAPVTGGDIGARNAALTILFGGSQELFDSLKDVFATMGKRAERLGDAGCGQLGKLCNQVAIAAGMMAMCESLALAKECKLDSALLLDLLTGGAAGSFSLQSYGPRILKGDFKPGFYLKHFVKDLKLALQVASDCKLELPGTALALKLYEKLEGEGMGDLGTQALYKYYEQESK